MAEESGTETSSVKITQVDDTHELKPQVTVLLDQQTYLDANQNSASKLVLDELIAVKDLGMVHPTA